VRRRFIYPHYGWAGNDIIRRPSVRPFVLPSVRCYVDVR